MSEKIQFFSDGIPFELKHKAALRTWIRKIATQHQKKIAGISYVFVSDDALLAMNQEFLQHDYYTDVITFDISEQLGVLEGEIYISIDRVKDNGFTPNNSFQRELHRVMIHGVLHLCGFKDKTKEQSIHIRKLEDQALAELQIS